MPINVAAGRALYALRSGTLTRIDAGATGPAPPVTFYTQDWSAAGVNNWRTQNNASNLARDATRHPDGALTWTATATADSTVEYAGQLTAVPGTTYTMTAAVSHNAAVNRSFFLSAITFTTNYASQTNFSSPSAVAVAPGTGTSTLSLAVTIPASQPLLGFSVGVVNMSIAEQMWVDTFTITRPA